MKRQRLETGIRRDGDSLQAYVHVRGQTHAKRFPLDTPVTVLRAWRETRRVGILHDVPDLTSRPTLALDAQAYLKLVTGMASYADRAYRIQQWVKALGGRPRASITARDIRAQLERWRLVGRNDGRGLSNASLNQRRTALMHLYTVLDGKGAANPVKDVPPYVEDSGDVVRAQPWRLLYRLLARMDRDCKTRARLRLMLWTGWPHTQIRQLQPGDIDWARQWVRISRRRKGKGARARWLPLLPPAVTALERFVAVKAWGAFSPSSMHSMLARAVADENAWRALHDRPALPKIRPYDFRHSAAAFLASRITDERVISEMLLTAQRRYTEAATAVRLETAIHGLRQEMGRKSAEVLPRRQGVIKG